MQMERHTRLQNLKERVRRISVFGKAAIVLVLVFLIVSACTIGGFTGAGRSYYMAADSNVVFYLDYQDGAKLDRVYLNVGSVYGEVGKDISVEFRYASKSSSSEPTFSSSTLGTVKLGNVYVSDAESTKGTNYDWVKVFDLTESGRSLSTSYCLIRLTVKTEMLVNEVVFVDAEGNIIPAYVTEKSVKSFFTDTQWPYYRDLFTKNDNTKEYGKAGDPTRLTDAQDNYADGNTAYTDFTQDEKYTLMQIDDILLGRMVVEGTFHAQTDFGPFAVLLPMLGTLIFGASPFGLRIFSVLCTTAMIVFVYLLGKRLFKSSGFGFMFACFAALGGLALTVGRLGLAYPMIALFAAAAYYFMFRFYEDGISKERPVKSAANVLVSGIFFAFAFATDPKAVFALIGLAALFIVGWVRIHRQGKAELAAVRKAALDKNASSNSEEEMLKNLQESEQQERLIRMENGYSTRILWLFFLVSFIVATVFITVLSAIPSYFTYVKLYDANPAVPTIGIFGLVWAAVKDSFTLSNMTAFTSANAVNPFGWFLSLKGATLFSSGNESVYIAMNAQMNLALAITSLIGLIFTTIYVILYFATGKTKSAYASAHTPYILNAYFLLLAGLATSLLQYLFAGSTSAANSLLFSVFYAGFAVLMFYTAYVHDTGARKKLFGIPMNTTLKVMTGVCVVYALIFVLTVPMLFGIPIAPLAAQICFGWTTFLSNGIYRP